MSRKIFLLQEYYQHCFFNFYIGLEKPLGIQEVQAPSISRQSPHEGHLITPTHRSEGKSQ